MELILTTNVRLSPRGSGSNDEIQELLSDIKAVLHKHLNSGMVEFNDFYESQIFIGNVDLTERR